MTLVVPYRPHNKNWVDRQAEWYFEKMTTARWPYLLEAVQTAVEAITMVGLLVTCRRKEKLHRLREEFAFNAHDHGLPPLIPFSHFDTWTYTRSHLAEVAIDEGRIWMRRHNKWKPVLYNGPTPIFVKADGANLIVIGEDHSVHYKKLFAEFRGDNFPAKKHVHFIGESLESYDYFVVDKSGVANWKVGLFHPPFTWPLYRLLKPLKIDPSRYRSVTMSHRGVFSAYYTDYAGKKHPNGHGTTTVSLLAQDGRSCKKKDPWCPPCSKITVPLYDIGYRYFTALREETSASIYMYVGYWSDQSDLTILTVEWDVDIRGSNPFFKYSFDSDDKEARTLSPSYVWREHKMPPGVSILPKINILQTGMGEAERMLYVAGVKARVRWGVFTKKIMDGVEGWNFIPDPLQRDALPSPLVPQPSVKQNSHVRTVVCSFKGHRLEILNFGPGIECSAAVLKMNAKSYLVAVVRRLSLYNYLGVDKPCWDVVIPDIQRKQAELIKLFGDRVSCSIDLSRHYECVKRDL